MTDLQCPATFVVLSDDGSDAAAGWAPGARLAAVYAGPAEDATATRVAAAAGLSVSALDAPERAPAYADVLADLADVHRGETVAVVLPATAVAELAALAGSGPSSAGGPLVVAVDSDGLTVRGLD